MQKILFILCCFSLNAGIVKAQTACPDATELANVLQSVGRTAIINYVKTKLNKPIKDIDFTTLTLNAQPEQHKNGDSICHYYHANFSKPLFRINMGKIKMKNIEDVKKTKTMINKKVVLKK